MEAVETMDPDALLAEAVAADDSYDDGPEDETPQTPGDLPVPDPEPDTSEPEPETAPEEPAQPDQTPDTQPSGDVAKPAKGRKPREYKYNRESLIDILQKAVANNGGKVPGIRQAYAKELGLVQPQHFIRVFGDWNSAVQAAGFEPLRKGTKGSGRKAGIANRSPEEIAAEKAKLDQEKANRKAEREAKKAEREQAKADKAAEREQARAAREAERAAKKAAKAEAEKNQPAEAPAEQPEGDVAANVSESADGDTNTGTENETITTDGDTPGSVANDDNA